MYQTNFPQRVKAARDIFDIMRYNNHVVNYYEGGLYALRVWNEAVVLVEAKSYREAEILAEAFNKVKLSSARKEYLKELEEADNETN